MEAGVGIFSSYGLKFEMYRSDSVHLPDSGLDILKKIFGNTEFSFGSFCGGNGLNRDLITAVVRSAWQFEAAWGALFWELGVWQKQMLCSLRQGNMSCILEN